jgi:hypothetical protein
VRTENGLSANGVRTENGQSTYQVRRTYVFDMVRPVMTEETVSALEDLTAQYFEVSVESVSSEQQLSVLIEKHQELQDEVQNLKRKNRRLKNDSSNQSKKKNRNAGWD